MQLFDAEILRISDNVMMLHGAKIVAEGTPAEVQASKDPIVQNFIYPERKKK